MKPCVFCDDSGTMLVETKAHPEGERVNCFLCQGFIPGKFFVDEIQSQADQSKDQKATEEELLG